MKKFGFATIVASGLAAAALGLGAPVANAGIDHLNWLGDIHQQVDVAQVDNSVHQGR